MPRIRVYTWYIEPLNDFTNEHISREIPPENAYRDKLCADKKRRNLWACTHGYALITLMKRSHVEWRFNVFVQEGNGQIMPFKPKARTLLSHVKKASALK